MSNIDKAVTTLIQCAVKETETVVGVVGTEVAYSSDFEPLRHLTVAILTKSSDANIVQ